MNVANPRRKCAEQGTVTDITEIIRHHLVLAVDDDEVADQNLAWGAPDASKRRSVEVVAGLSVPAAREPGDAGPVKRPGSANVIGGRARG